MSSTAHGSTPYYYVPHESRHPFMASVGLFFVILGAGQWINGSDWGKYALFFGLAWWLVVLYSGSRMPLPKAKAVCMATRSTCPTAGA